MNTSHSRNRGGLRLLQILSVMVLAGCAGLGGIDTVPEARIAQIVRDPGRTAADRANDLRRKPESMLAFIGLRPGMTALDLSAGGGYTTELLARAIGPSGVVYGQSQPRDPGRAGPVAPEGNAAPNLPAGPAAVPRTSAVALTERQQRLAAAQVAAAPIIAVQRRFEDPVPPERAQAGLDLVTLIFNYHDLGHMGTDRARMNAAVFAALKPGGSYVIADHSGRAGTGISEAGTLHRVEEAFLRREVEAAGFRWVGSGDFLRNPADPRDRNTPEPPMPKDEFVLKFIRP